MSLVTWFFEHYLLWLDSANHFFTCKIWFYICKIWFYTCKIWFYSWRSSKLRKNGHKCYKTHTKWDVLPFYKSSWMKGHFSWNIWFNIHSWLLENDSWVNKLAKTTKISISMVSLANFCHEIKFKVVKWGFQRLLNSFIYVIQGNICGHFCTVLRTIKCKIKFTGKKKFADSYGTGTACSKIYFQKWSTSGPIFSMFPNINLCVFLASHTKKIWEKCQKE